MKITGIDIGEYRQFKNIKFDFTYPEDYRIVEKRGQPLEKVCFIGQSGTGKTTLLNVIWDLVYSIEKIVRLHSGPPREFPYKGEFLPDHVEDTKYSFNLDGVEIFFDRNEHIAKADEDFVKIWFEKLTVSQQEKLSDISKLCIYVKDSIAREADAFLFDQKNQPQAFSDFVKTDTEIEQEKNSTQQKINKVGASKLVSLGDLKSLSTWQYILNDINHYDETSQNFLLNLVQNTDNRSVSLFMEAAQRWMDLTPNPRTDLAENCLNPILKNFHLETDIKAGAVPITLRTKQGTKIPNNTLSTGTRQILATAIPIYKFDTKDTVILFDEPERSLFPDIQRELVKYYTGLAPEAQFFFATHSPIIAAAFEPCERFILYFDENGEVNYRNGVAPIGDDPNDILHADFGLNELMLDEGLEAYQKYRQLGALIRQETDEEKKNKLIAERLELGNRYNF